MCEVTELALSRDEYEKKDDKNDFFVRSWTSD